MAVICCRFARLNGQLKSGGRNLQPQMGRTPRHEWSAAQRLRCMSARLPENKQARTAAGEQGHKSAEDHKCVGSITTVNSRRSGGTMPPRRSGGTMPPLTSAPALASVLRSALAHSFSPKLLHLMAAPAVALPSFSSAGSSWDAAAWLRAFATATHPRTLNPEYIKALRQSVWASTSGAVARGEYFTGGAVVKLNDAGEFDALHQGTVFYGSTEEERMKVPAHKRGVYRTRVTVQEGDCLEAAQQLLDEARREQAV